MSGATWERIEAFLSPFQAGALCVLVLQGCVLSTPARAPAPSATAAQVRLAGALIAPTLATVAPGLPPSVLQDAACASAAVGAMAAVVADAAPGTTDQAAAIDALVAALRTYAAGAPGASCTLP